MATVNHSKAWQALQAHAKGQGASIQGLFDADPLRAKDFSLEACGLYLDFSKQRLDRAGLGLLLTLAAEQKLGDRIRSLFAGDPVNNTEHRPALHMALRAPEDARFLAGGTDVMPAVHAVQRRMWAFARALREGRWRGYSERRITDVVNIGIGGSDLGPRMVCSSLASLATGPRMHFVANVDGAQIAGVLRGLDPATTLFIITSKTFTTQETMANAQAARRWFLNAAEESDIARHFVAVSTNRDEVARFGIAADNMFEFWDWVGGRYSLWSAVGLSILVSLGEEAWDGLHTGARAMDLHFHDAPPERNLPVVMALLNVWNTNFLGYTSQVIAPYAQSLEQLVHWLQQLEMESNGKSVSRNGEPLPYPTTPALWGDVGTNSQHAFFQMLHQGVVRHPVEFILPVEPTTGSAEQHRLLAANCLAQGAALMRGKTAAQVREELLARGMDAGVVEEALPHRIFAGNCPSNTLLLPRLDAYSLGALLALYEHRAFAQSVLWDVNAFDQWGVELGKQLAGDVLRSLGGAPAPGLDASTVALMRRVWG